MSKMSRFCTGKMVILLDSSGNNPVIAKRIVRKTGHYYFPFPIYDKEGKEITEEHSCKNSNLQSRTLENQTDSITSNTLEDLTETKSIKSRRNVRPIK